jgi:outer membrane protein OmpA-like peptidoglycan-associated protein
MSKRSAGFLQGLLGLSLLVWQGSVLAQVPNPTQRQAAPIQRQAPIPVAQDSPTTPIFRITVVSRTISAINYHHRTGTTKIDFQGTQLMPEAKGHASVESRMGSTKIDTEVEHLPPASKFGPEFLTYVMWAITPEGRAQNLGEVVLQGGDNKAKLLSTTELQAFGLIVTAEPYFAVTQPSDVVVMENFIRNDTTGTFEHVEAKYELLQRGSYIMNKADYRPVKIDPKGPLQLAEARNAVEIAKLAGAETYARDTFEKALSNLQNAEGFGIKNHDRKREEATAREATQMAEDARIITIKKIQEEQLAQERAASAEREAGAKAEEAKARAEADAEAQRRAQAEADSQRAQADRLAAESAKRDAEAAQAAALAQQQAAQLETEKARQAADEANRARQQAEGEKAELRSQLLQQLNLILETRDTARGLIVNMSDVLFDTAKYTLRSGAREKLAKISGIVVSHPGLRLAVEGHTDNVGGDEYNQRLSEQRATSVRDYLVAQGVPATSVTARGFGKTTPVTSNDTAAGRQQNRRVELVVSGEVIGAEVSGLR